MTAGHLFPSPSTKEFASAAVVGHADFALFKHLLQGDIELLDHGNGRSFGRGEAEPDVNVEAGPPSPGPGRNNRIRRPAPASRSGKCSNLVFRCQRERPDDAAE